MIRKILAACLLLLAPGLAAARAWPGCPVRIFDQGGAPLDLAPAQCREFLQAGITAWGAVIRAGNIRAE